MLELGCGLARVVSRLPASAGGLDTSQKHVEYLRSKVNITRDI